MKRIDWTKWSSISEIISSVAIVATLIYLTIQTRQNTDALLANTRHTIIMTDAQVLAAGIVNPGIEHSMYKPQLSDDEKVQLEWWLIELCRSREHQWFQYRNGLLDKETWEANLSALGRNLTFARTNAWWKLFAYDYFDDAFVDEVDRYLEDKPIIRDWVHPFDRVDSGAP